MNWNISQKGNLWILRRPAGNSGVTQFKLRRDAIAAAKKSAKKSDFIVVRNSSGMVVIRQEV